MTASTPAPNGASVNDLLQMATRLFRGVVAQMSAAGE